MDAVKIYIFLLPIRPTAVRPHTQTHTHIYIPYYIYIYVYIYTQIQYNVASLTERILHSTYVPLNRKAIKEKYVRL